MRLPVLKFHYITEYAILGAVMPYLPVYLGQLGFDEARISWVMGVYGLAVLVAPPLFSFLADRFLSNRILIGLCYFLSVISLTALAYTEKFPLLLLTFILFSLGYTAVMPLLDGLTFGVFDHLKEQGQTPPPYAKVRIYGSYGFMLPAFGLFFLLAQPGTTSRTAIFTAAGIAAIGLLVAPALPRIRGRNPDRKRLLPTFDALRTLRRPEVFTFLGSLFVLFLALAAFYTFYPLYLDRLGVPQHWIGLISNLGVVAEVGFMFAAGPILHRIGFRGLMLLGTLATTARFLLLATVPWPPAVILTQIAHGPLVLATYLAAPMYLNLKASETYRTSIQGLYVLLCFGVARLLGSLSAGYVADFTTSLTNPIVGLQVAFGSAALLAGIATLWLALAFRDPQACHALRQQHT